MAYTLSDAARVLRKLLDHGVRYVVIGDLPVKVELGIRNIEGDIDLYVIEPSAFIEQEFYGELAEKEGWGYGLTDIGTPRFVARVNGAEIPVEFYENIFDIYIPEDIIKNAKRIKINGVTIRAISIEDYFVLKARQGVDLDKLAEYYRRLKNKLKREELVRKIELFPEEDRKIIVRRLAEIGINVTQT